MRGDREAHRLFIQAFGGGRPSDAAAVFLTRVRRELRRTILRATGEQLADPFRETRHELGVDVLTAFRLAFSAPGPGFSIVQALGLSPLERRLFDQ
ncbi:MAG: hypothetical protein HY657_00830 [Acidobacteria bacterium]|nr:hypothetical protein [Acidobacteriota bacterium]